MSSQIVGTVLKNGKHLVQALKVIGAVTKFVNITFDAHNGMTILAMSDNKVFYHCLYVRSCDITLQGDGLLEGGQRVGIELKGLVHALRNVTTLTDVIIFKLDVQGADKLTVITKSKKEETCVDVPLENVMDIVLDTSRPEGSEKKIGEIEFVTKTLEDKIKEISETHAQDHAQDHTRDHTNTQANDIVYVANSLLNWSVEEQSSACAFRSAFIDHCCRSTLAKKVKVSVYHDNPICFEYKLLTGSHLAIYTIPCNQGM